MIVNGQKQCTACGEWKAAGEFYRDKKKKDGLKSQCKPCKRERVRRWRENNPEREREQHRRWRENNPERARERIRRYRENNPERKREQCRRWRAEQRHLRDFLALVRLQAWANRLEADEAPETEGDPPR